MELEVVEGSRGTLGRLKMEFGWLVERYMVLFFYQVKTLIDRVLIHIINKCATLLGVLNY